MAMRWRRDKKPSGLAGVAFTGKLGSTLNDSDVHLASVNFSEGKFGNSIGWYWSCPSNASLGIEHRNTANAMVDTEDEAKKQAKAYIDACLKAHVKASSST